MKIAYLDCFSGVAGDMLLGALIDAGVPADALRAEIAKLKIDGVELKVEKCIRKGITGTDVHVVTGHDHAHRHLSTIEKIIDGSDLAARVKDRAKRIFRNLGEAEAAIHGIPVEKVHFHEVGAVDAIVDIVGACAGLDLLGIEKLYCSPLNLGSGTVKAAHGVMPVPAPATAALVKGLPTYSDGPAVELTTPTGAAIVSTLAESFGPMPAMSIGAVGYGAGDKDFPDRANMVRLVAGETSSASESTQIFVIEANVDDMSPEWAGYVREQLLDQGALDVTMTPGLHEEGPPRIPDPNAGEARGPRPVGRPAAGGDDDDRHPLLRGAAARARTLLEDRVDDLRRRARQGGVRCRDDSKLRPGVRRLQAGGPREAGPAQDGLAAGQLRIPAPERARAPRAMSKYYLTTPIYYVNASPHIGHAYTTLTADTIKRFRRMMGDEAYLTTGTDEHGQKVEQSARAAGWTPQSSPTASRTPSAANGTRSGSTTTSSAGPPIRCTRRRCTRSSCAARSRGHLQGRLYRQVLGDGRDVRYRGRSGGLDPDKVVEVTEENYFFRLSAFEDKLLELYRAAAGLHRAGIAAQRGLAFVKEGLKDLSISRSTLKWGIPLPNDPDHVFYVWFDALTTYMSAIGYGEDGERRKTWSKLWPADVHLVGKEILRFHAVYWPAFLMAAGLPLPKKIYAHGWLVFQGGKMSKSRGNIVRALPIHKVVGVEGLRYYLLREIVFGQDGNFSWEALVGRYNSDLANGIGNLLSRTVTMIHKYRDGKVPAPPEDHDGGLAQKARETIPAVIDHYERFEFSKALEAIWGLLGAVDKYIVEMKPWLLAKAEDAESQAKLDATLYNSAESLRIASVLAYPVLPTSTPKIWSTLGQPGALDDYRIESLAWGGLQRETRIGEPEALYPRLDVELAVKEMQELEEQALKEQAEIMGKAPETAAPRRRPKKPSRQSSSTRPRSRSTTSSRSTCEWAW